MRTCVFACGERVRAMVEMYVRNIPCDRLTPPRSSMYTGKCWHLAAVIHSLRERSLFDKEVPV